MTDIKADPVAATDVVDILTEDHHAVLDLIAELHVTADPQRCRALADVVIAEVVRHAVAEEAVVYPAMRDYLPAGDHEVDHDLDEHKAIEKTLKDLEGLDPQDTGFALAVDTLEAELRHHAGSEENEQFPILRASIPAEELVRMGKKVQRIKSMAPTRPHPEAPDNPMFHMVVGPGVGLVDRLRDHLSQRQTNPDEIDLT